MGFFSEEEGFVPSESGSRRISTAGVAMGLHLVSVNYIDTPAKPAEGNKPAKAAWQACELVFENAAGEQHKELFMRPPYDPTKVKADKTAKWYDTIDGKKVNTRNATVDEHIQIKNNEFVYFMTDLAEALGYQKPNILAAFKKAKDFGDVVKIFKDSFKFSEKNLLNVKISWQNNDAWEQRKASSWLRIYYSAFPMYYPYSADLFEQHVPNRPSTLQYSKFEVDRGVLVEKYPYQAPAGPDTNNPLVNQGAANAAPGAGNWTGQQGSTAAGGNKIDDLF